MRGSGRRPDGKTCRSIGLLTPVTVVFTSTADTPSVGTPARPVTRTVRSAPDCTAPPCERVSSSRVGRSSWKPAPTGRGSGLPDGVGDALGVGPGETAGEPPVSAPGSSSADSERLPASSTAQTSTRAVVGTPLAEVAVPARSWRTPSTSTTVAVAAPVLQSSPVADQRTTVPSRRRSCTRAGGRASVPYRELLRSSCAAPHHCVLALARPPVDQANR